MPRASRVPRLGRCLRRPRWAALALLFVTTSVLAQPPTGPIQRIYAPASAGDTRAAGLEFGKAAEEPLREAPGIHAGGFTYRARTDYVSITRKVDSQPAERRADRDSIVQPGDVIYVYERYF